MNTIRINQLKITYMGEVVVDIAFEIRRSLALVGASGSGKSLSLKALLGLLDPTLDVLIEKECDFEWERGKSIALVPQNPFTPNATYERNFTYKCRYACYSNKSRCAKIYRRHAVRSAFDG